MNDFKLNTYGSNYDPRPEDGETDKMMHNNDVRKPDTMKDMNDDVMYMPPASANGQAMNNPKKHHSRQRKKCGPAWFEFCENTTLHGLRQIAEPQPYFLRRLIWIVLVVAGATLFIYQMINGIVYYYQYPVSVNVQINYNNTLMFPSFTICNQNAFRKTVAVENGWYDSVSKVFSHKGHHHEVEVYNNTDMTVYELFNTTGHALEDLVVKCTWDGTDCSHDAFQLQMTDYGKCYTFNSLPPYREAKRTGTEGGLKLLLNVEQYEYMPGPNQGAGIRVLLHNHVDAPLVRDFGVAVPPGSYSLLGTTMIRIKNLPAPHGKCDDNEELKYYANYTKQNCLQDCEQKFAEKHCGCRHINMVHRQDNISQCTLHEYQVCLSPKLEEFNKKDRDNCSCPIPCLVDSLELFNSIGDISAFDALNLLNSGLTKQLEPKYQKAQEVSQRVNKETVREDNEIITELAEAVQEVQLGLDEIVEGLQHIEEYTINQVFAVLEKRLKFHRKKGLEKVLYIMEHDFVRGWTILEERTLPYLTFDFYELRGTFRRVIETLAASQNGTELEKFLALSRWATMENALQERLDISVRVTDNVTEVHECYKSGKPVLTYRSSLNRRYDKSWITVELLQANVDDDSNNQDTIYEQIFRRLNQFITATNNYLEMGKNFTETYEIDDVLWKKTDKLFRDGCVFYNYQIFLYKTRIVDGPVIVIKERIDEFERLNRTLYLAKNRLKMHMDAIKDSIMAQRNSTWKALNSALDEARLYLNDTGKSKSELATIMNSGSMVKTIRDLHLFFGDLRSEGRVMDEKMFDFKLALQEIWTNMLGEYTTSNFYAKVREDFLNFQTDPSFYLPYFANLLGTSVAKIEDKTADEFEYLLNADFSVMNATEKIAEIEDRFRMLENVTNIGRILGVKDEVFSTAVNRFTSSLSSFQKMIVIDTDFYKSNFIQMSVFMQELSYEEIIQQPAYDTLNLLGDIGGSVGLFLGASALTLAEIMDVIILQIVNYRNIRYI